MNAPLLPRAWDRLMARAHDKELGDLKVSLPTCRVWVHENRGKTTTSYEQKRGETWVRCELQDLTPEEYGRVIVYAKTGGMSEHREIVMIRFTLTQEAYVMRCKTPEGVPLTQEEVDALPEGSKVVVTWSGGNGPAEYEVRREFDQAVAYYQEVRIERLDGCGAKQPKNQVWRKKEN